MKVNSFEECLAEYDSFNGWDNDDNILRAKALETFPNSVVAQGDFNESDSVWKKRR
jgi:hypothetical protein